MAGSAARGPARSTTFPCVSASSKKLLLVLLSALVAVGPALLVVRSRQHSSPAKSPGTSSSRISPELAGELAALEAREQHVAETVWAQELLAQECGRAFESLWDSLNASTNKVQLLAAFPLGEIVMPRWSPPQALPHGIELRESAGPGLTLSTEDWRRWVEEFERTGWQLVQTEFRHNRFDADDTGQPRQSGFYFSAHLTHSSRPERAILEGDLVVDWALRPLDEEFVPVKRIDASHLTLKTREGDPPFRPIVTETMAPPRNAYSIGPLMLYDLDGDGLSEIILAAKNLVYRRRGEDHYEAEPLCRYSPGVIDAALIADFDGDGAADFLCVRYGGVFLFKGSPQGTFDEPGRLVWRAPRDVKSPFALTCGEVDHNGDLDVFLGQYKSPYDNGSMPTPYYDANDGDPAYLLHNDGQGNFTDVTEASGLGAKRWRRTYGASFADLDDDGHLDLAVVNDFAGLDLYRNDGRGRFSDVTRAWIDEPHAFGMADALTDFNADGRIDLLLISMPSATADRLEHLNLWRPGSTEDRTMRAKMTCGNRLYLARTNGGFARTPLNDSIARSGWSWGCAAFDFDNDGFPDVYIGNGQDSRETVQDYEGEYWLHDLYVGNSQENPAAHLYFQGKFGRTLARGQSYGGYEKNRFYLSRDGASFLEIGHLLGVALELDSRNVVADDLDGDGRVDLLVTTYEPWPSSNQTLRAYRNLLGDAGNWIGFRFREESGGRSPVGVQVRIGYDGHRAVRQIVTGDSHRSQHATTVHFGLGKVDRVDRVEIRWPNGQTITLSQPEVNRYHSIHAPPGNHPRP
jgi:enediyne biosynthesis protein E4